MRRGSPVEAPPSGEVSGVEEASGDLEEPSEAEFYRITIGLS
ncbi:hypothetical protein [Nesterenkonia sphaerica]|nr:hypothetical protein [Nesterenkonia sphaerica]